MTLWTQLRYRWYRIRYRRFQSELMFLQVRNVEGADHPTGHMALLTRHASGDRFFLWVMDLSAPNLFFDPISGAEVRIRKWDSPWLRLDKLWYHGERGYGTSLSWEAGRSLLKANYAYWDSVRRRP